MVSCLRQDMRSSRPSPPGRYGCRRAIHGRTQTGDRSPHGRRCNACRIPIQAIPKGDGIVGEQPRPKHHSGKRDRARRPIAGVEVDGAETSRPVGVVEGVDRAGLRPGPMPRRMGQDENADVVRTDLARDRGRSEGSIPACETADAVVDDDGHVQGMARGAVGHHRHPAPAGADKDQPVAGHELCAGSDVEVLPRSEIGSDQPVLLPPQRPTSPAERGGGAARPGRRVGPNRRGDTAYVRPVAGAAIAYAFFR